MKKIILTLISILLVLAFGAACTKKVEAPQGPLQSFHYEFGSYNGGYWAYTLTREKEGKAHLLAKGMNGVDLNLDEEIDSKTLDQIADILDKNKVAAWNGFNERDNAILDGYGFSLKADYGEEKIEASGYMKYPKNYQIVHDSLVEILNGLQK
ncbi:MAG: hypothetical protein VB108_00290 [Anaerolineaceae bacterium]|nr:hypothetical protein [Anaerolineaceae bacterium]